MLCTTLKIGGAIKIGDNITVTILEVQGNKVRVAIDAPKDIPVTKEDAIEKGVSNEIKHKRRDQTSKY